MKKGILFLFVLTVFLSTTHGNALAFDSPLKVGWVMGWDENNAYILHTKTGGRKWVVQGKWPSDGNNALKISAIDKQTVWAAIASPEGDGIILHTTNGGVTWTEQIVLEGVSIYGLKGLTRHEAWAVSSDGQTVLHTTDGGKVWNIVEHPDFHVDFINRMDAIGYRDVRDEDRSGKNTGPIHANVWIVGSPEETGKQNGMIHTLYNGEIWRRESIPCENWVCNAHMVSAYSPRVVWAAAWSDGNLYRTTDGGETWNGIDTGKIGANDIDDMCAYSADALWLVQYLGTSIGSIYHVTLENEGAEVETFNPVPGYNYEGLACVDDQTAVVVGYTELPDPPPPQKERGIILLTNDGGETWERQPLPVDDVSFWKVSFVGACR